ncbi:hypothetical protein BDZ89DRAFT_1046764 [Hymenopellis radicata]|nr:hypothetical protein BDZ89DRAFT_1046764 [Hymenopellis radicata]
MPNTPRVMFPSSGSYASDIGESSISHFILEKASSRLAQVRTVEILEDSVATCPTGKAQGVRAPYGGHWTVDNLEIERYSYDGFRSMLVEVSILVWESHTGWKTHLRARNSYSFEQVDVFIVLTPDCVNVTSSTQRQVTLFSLSAEATYPIGMGARESSVLVDFLQTRLAEWLVLGAISFISIAWGTVIPLRVSLSCAMERQNRIGRQILLIRVARAVVPMLPVVRLTKMCPSRSPLLEFVPPFCSRATVTCMSCPAHAREEDPQALEEDELPNDSGTRSGGHFLHHQSCFLESGGT